MRVERSAPRYSVSAWARSSTSSPRHAASARVSSPSIRIARRTTEPSIARRPPGPAARGGSLGHGGVTVSVDDHAARARSTSSSSKRASGSSSAGAEQLPQPPEPVAHGLRVHPSSRRGAATVPACRSQASNVASSRAREFARLGVERGEPLGRELGDERRLRPPQQLDAVGVGGERRVDARDPRRARARRTRAGTSARRRRAARRARSRRRARRARPRELAGGAGEHRATRVRVVRRACAGRGGVGGGAAERAATRAARRRGGASLAPHRDRDRRREAASARPRPPRRPRRVGRPGSSRAARRARGGGAPARPPARPARGRSPRRTRPRARRRRRRSPRRAPPASPAPAPPPGPGRPAGARRPARRSGRPTAARPATVPRGPRGGRGPRRPRRGPTTPAARELDELGQRAVHAAPHRARPSRQRPRVLRDVGGDRGHDLLGQRRKMRGEHVRLAREGRKLCDRHKFCSRTSTRAHKIRALCSILFRSYGE